MLSTVEIASILKNPKDVNQAQLDALRELSEKYSYTPLYSILLLQGTAQLNPLHLEVTVGQHAYRLPSRVKLFDLLETNTTILSEDETPSALELIEDDLEIAAEPAEIALQIDVSPTELEVEPE
jgi:hypothetical protein